VTFQDAGQNVGVLHKADAIGDADLLEAHLLGELNDFLDPRPFTVALGFNPSGLQGDVMGFGIVV
jgi:hypothetical protein